MKIKCTAKNKLIVSKRPRKERIATKTTIKPGLDDASDFHFSVEEDPEKKRQKDRKKTDSNTKQNWIRNGKL